MPNHAEFAPLSITAVVAHGRVYLLVSINSHHPSFNKKVFELDVEKEGCPGFLTIAGQLRNGKFNEDALREFSKEIQRDSIPAELEQALARDVKPGGARMIGRWSVDDNILEIDPEILRSCKSFSDNTSVAALDMAKHPTVRWLLGF